MQLSGIASQSFRYTGFSPTSRSTCDKGCQTNRRDRLSARWVGEHRGNSEVREVNTAILFLRSLGTLAAKTDWLSCLRLWSTRRKRTSGAQLAQPLGPGRIALKVNPANLSWGSLVDLRPESHHLPLPGHPGQVISYSIDSPPVPYYLFASPRK